MTREPHDGQDSPALPALTLDVAALRSADPHPAYQPLTGADLRALPVPALVVAALRFVDPHPAYQPLTGAVWSLAAAGGPSEADRCALELALQLAAELGGRCLAVTAGPPAADRMLRDALAAGTDAVLRVDAPWLDPLTDDGSGTAAALAAGLAAALSARPALVLCGDHSADRGTGATPAFLAARLGAAQALGLLDLSTGAPAPSSGGGGPGRSAVLYAVRRLDGGRRERLVVPLPAVCSVEPAGVRLRRASLPATVAAASASIPVVIAPPRPARLRLETPAAYRPRPKPVALPPGDDPRYRILALTGALTGRTPPRLVTPASPVEAVEELLAYLRPLLPDVPWPELDAAGHQQVGDGEAAR